MTDYDHNSADDSFANLSPEALNEALRVEVALFVDARAARCRADAVTVRALASAYAIAGARDVIAPPARRDFVSIDRAFAGHLRSVVGEFAIVTNSSDIALQRRAHTAHQLVTEFPEWVEALERAEIEYTHILGMLDPAVNLPADKRPEYAAALLDYARTHTSSETKQRAKKHAVKLAAEDFEATHGRARAERRVRISHDDFGMSTIDAYLPTEVAVPIKQLLEDQARILRNENQAAAASFKAATRTTPDQLVAAGEGISSANPESVQEFVPDERTIAQLQADIFADTLLTSTPQQILESETQGAPRVQTVVSVTIPVLSLLERKTCSVDGVVLQDLSDPALLNGWHPMSARQARQFAAEAPALQRILTHPITGHTLTVDARQADASLRRFLQVRDVTCRFPGCVRPAARSDLDHTVAYVEGGPTAQHNLGHLCRSHHVQKHQRGWTLAQLGGGVLQWTSPIGEIATTAPEPPGPRFKRTDPPGPGITVPKFRPDSPPPF